MNIYDKYITDKRDWKDIVHAARVIDDLYVRLFK